MKTGGSHDWKSNEPANLYVPSINDVEIPMEVSELRYKSDCSRVESVEFEEISELI